MAIIGALIVLMGLLIINDTLERIEDKLSDKNENE